MSSMIFEFQNLEVPKKFETEFSEIMHGVNVSCKIRKSLGLSGMETLIIAIAGTVASTYIIRLIDHISTSITKNIKLEFEDSGEIYKLPNDYKKLLNKKNE